MLLNLILIVLNIFSFITGENNYLSSVSNEKNNTLKEKILLDKIQLSIIISYTIIKLFTYLKIFASHFKIQDNTVLEYHF